MCRTRPSVRAACLLLATLVFLAMHAPMARSELAPFAGAVNVVPSSPKVGNCVPFANNVDFGFSGFIYRNVPAFTIQQGVLIAFDLSGTNDVDVRRDIYLSHTDVNPVPGNGNVRAVAWTKVVSDAQVPENPRGNTTVGDYELRYRAEQAFTFAGGGLAVGFGGSPPGAYRDTGCEQVGVHTSSTDTSNTFYGRFWSKPDRDTSVLNRGTFSNTFISGFVAFVDITPPVVTATITPAPGADGWVDAQGDAATVTWSGTDDQSGVASCDAPAQLTEPGTHTVTGHCTDHAGNVGDAAITVRLARHVDLDVMPHNAVNPFNRKRKGFSAFAVRSGPGFDARRIDVSSIRFGVTGNEDSVESCLVRGVDLECRFSIANAGLAKRMVFTAFADGIRLLASDTLKIVGRR
jgi:hypothetical protein